MTTRRVGITDLAAEFSMDRNLCRRYLAEAGVARSAGDNKFDYRSAAAALRARKDKASVIGNRVAGRAGGKLTPIDFGDLEEEEIDPLDCTPSRPKASPAPASPAEKFSELADLKAEEVRLRNRRAALKAAQEEGRLIDRAAVEATVAALVVKARTALLSLGHRVAPEIVGETDVSTVAAAVNAEAMRCLAELADEAEAVRRVLA